ncbi:MAG: SUMF1/EgtB/PvdO family nonheme iron enzyme [Leptospiraceae bacterium]|nr:SUMF1/EgtB/PvdO family nonheme iron enzyme [Leptospiraceae bacterium]
MKKLIIILFLSTAAITCAGCGIADALQTGSGYKPCPADLPTDMACVPGGFFWRGSNDSQWKDERPAMQIELSTFLIDKYEVTVRKYQECVKSGACQLVQSNYLHMRKPDFPQLKANWFQARDYCKAQGKRLPTEAEFEKASRGPDGELYSWGNQAADCSLAVIKDKRGKRGCVGGFIHDTGTVANVGSRPAGRYGLFDMTGNAHEWVADWYHPDYQKCGVDCNGRDPQGPCAGRDTCPGFGHKVIKGGSWYWDADWARAAKRRDWQPSNEPPHHFGFRCAKSL